MGCGSVPEGPEPPPQSEAAEVEPGVFSAPNAWHHLSALARIGARETGSRGAARTRSYLAEQLEEIGAEVEIVALTLPAASQDAEPRVATQLLATLPGASQDRFLLAAAYDTRPLPGVDFVGANASASGTALVLELARALSQRPLAYTVTFAFVDGDALPATRAEADFLGSRALASWLASDERIGFSRIRLAVYFQQVADVDLSLARDLRSHHIYREFFWEAAAALGREVYFPSDAKLESVDAGHVELIERGLPRTVVIADPRFGGDEVPGRYAATDKDTPERCSPDSLQVVGEVALEGLERISARLARMDRFRDEPLRDPSAPAAREAPMPDPLDDAGGPPARARGGE